MSTRPFHDLTGQRFGKLQVGSETTIRSDSKARTQRYWSCTCDCGKTKAIRANSLLSGHSTSCSAVKHRQGKFLNITGHRYHQVLVVAYAGNGLDVKTGKRYRVWRCRCDCGREFITRAASLRQGKTRSCGCLRANKARLRFKALHLLSRVMTKEEMLGFEWLAQTDNPEVVLKNALGSLPVPPDKGRSA